MDAFNQMNVYDRVQNPYNPRNGKQVVVRINDRGPFSQSRIIDLSRAAARHLGLEGSGHGHVVLHEAQ